MTRMITSEAFAQLHRHQAAILETFGHAIRLVEGEPQLVQRSLSIARWTLAQQSREYQLFKRTEIFEPTIRYGSAERASQASELMWLCTGRHEALIDYVRHWTSRDVVGEWVMFKAATCELAVTLRQALAQERKDITGLLAGCARTRQLG
ncbi:hypothetical protein [uncultured Sphingomonas sp.]|uniref:hypothetical protein n=1 Tax=uncultured Sphingomonas sp. TaxID=158754 RepID=UPI0025E92E8F|nr:hypothetical protein [uncultured Sphingomonas sp.]